MRFVPGQPDEAIQLAGIVGEGTSHPAVFAFVYAIHFEEAGFDPKNTPEAPEARHDSFGQGFFQGTGGL